MEGTEDGAGTHLIQPVRRADGTAVVEVLVPQAQLRAGVTRTWLVLAGLGLTSLSMNAGAVRAVGASLAATTLEQCEAAAEVALAAADPASARAAVKEVF